MNQAQGEGAPVMELLRQGMSVIRIENETQQQMAVLKPRNENNVLGAVLAELKQCPEFAKKVFYSIPFKDGDKTIWVEGVSINGAMSIQRRWGNCASNCRVVEEKADRIITEGVCMDYENNVRVMRQVAVSRMYKPKNSNNLVPLRGDFLEKAIASGMSKAVRNAVLHSIPEFIKIEYLKEAKKIASMQSVKEGVKIPLPERIKSLIARYEELGITRPQLVAHMGKSDLKEVDYENLLGLCNALEDGYVKKESIFPEPGQELAPQRDSVDLAEVLENKGKK